MEYRTLGRSGLKVSVMTMGTMTFGGKRPFTKVGTTGAADAARQIDLCIDAGINLIDTANVYSAGVSEEIIGEALGGKRKGDVLIATKARMRDRRRRQRRGPVAPSSDPRVRGQPEAAEDRRHRHLLYASLGRRDAARGDAVGARYPHQPGQGPLRRLLQLLGLAHHEGARRSPSARACRASSPSRSTTRCKRARPNTSCCRSRSTRGSAYWCGARSPAACCRGKHRRGQPTPEGTRQLAGWTEPPIRDEERLWDIVDVLVEVAKERGVSGAQVALAWLLGRPAVTSLVIGGRNEEQFRDNIAAADLKLTRRNAQRLDKVSKPPLHLSLLAPGLHRASSVQRGRSGDGSLPRLNEPRSGFAPIRMLSRNRKSSDDDFRTAARPQYGQGG